MAAKTETLDDLRALLAADGIPVKDPNQEPPGATEAAAEPIVAAEPEPPAEVELEPEAEVVPAETKQQPKVEAKDSKDDELPEGVRKKIAKEVERESKIQRQIAEAVSNRKLAEAKLAEVSKGSEPVKQTEKETEVNPRPVRPDMNTFEGTNGEYNKAIAEYEKKLDAWQEAKAEAKAEARFAKAVEDAKAAAKAAVEQELTARQQAELERQQEESSATLWKEAIAKHGEEVIENAKNIVVKAISSKDLVPIQHAISDMDDWSGVTIKLAAEPELLRNVIASWKQSPIRAAFLLRDIEQSLKPPVVEKKNAPAITPLKPLPKPPSKVGGSASVTGKVFDPKAADLDLEELRAWKKAELKAS